ncbi:hypothetical protein HDV04_006194 [Boothiomyces sp. JEL0838]|nr:hypothetical protein HDV04_006194 [Boothiomyces sp. JEL0838]
MINLLFSLAAANPTPIKNVVHIMFENRAFDTIFGYLDHNPHIDNLANQTFCNHFNVSDPASPKVCTSKQLLQKELYSQYGPDHSFQSTQEQLYGKTSPLTKQDYDRKAPMNGFVQNALRTGSFPQNDVDLVMASFDPKDIPVFTTLAQEFMVCDRWFASGPGDTQPNRAFSHSGTSHGVIDSTAQTAISGFPQKNIIDVMMAKNRTWANYYLEIPTLILMQDLQQILQPGVNAFDLDSDFMKHAQAGTLPEYSFLDPYYGDFAGAANPDLNTTALRNDGSSPGLFGRAEDLLKRVYEAVRNGPQWNQTLLLVTFDEHGGFYDHVPPPANVPSPDGILGPPDYPFDFKRLGVRVPVLFISPWVKKGSVKHTPTSKPFNHSQFEHSSIPATLDSIFDLGGDGIALTNRTMWAGKFDDIFSKKLRTDAPTLLPNVVLPLK